MNLQTISTVLLFTTILVLLYLSQRYWFVQAWRLKDWLPPGVWGRGARAAILLALLAAGLTTIAWWSGLAPRRWQILAWLGVWLSTSLLAYALVKLVAGAEWLWSYARIRMPRRRKDDAAAELVVLENPSRRRFFETATYVAGAAPFVGALYGFAAERLRFGVERIEIPIANLPPALEGLRIAQLSDIHASIYLPVEQVRRAVQMANALGADLIALTGDYITGYRDPLEACIGELAALAAPHGVWGCLGNHEIYADAEDRATDLFRRAGLRMLRNENSLLRVARAGEAAALNLIGVDYQRSRDANGRRVEMLRGAEQLVRRDAPNILLSHNPNAFDRAAELGIELTLAGHTHGGQISVEILDRQVSPARFVTQYIAGKYEQRGELRAANGSQPPLASLQLSAVSGQQSAGASPAARPSPLATLYVNRGLGTVGAPVRLGAPPEITLLTLRCA